MAKVSAKRRDRRDRREDSDLCRFEQRAAEIGTFTRAARLAG
jgi:hypothetical protein